MGSKTRPSNECRDNDADERKMAWAKGLRARYDKVAQKALPDRFRDLLEQVDDAESCKRWPQVASRKPCSDAPQRSP
jgi:hypothetical protein